MTTSIAPFFFRWLCRSVIALVGLLILLIVLLVAVGMYVASQQTEDRLKVRPATGMYVAAADTQMFVQMRGDPHAPAVIFVHGTGAWSEIWSASMDDVVKAGYRAVAIDLPPFGYSVPPESGKYDKGSQAKRILALLDSLHIQKAVFVAHSIGSAPLMEALLQSPQRVSKLILVCGALGLDSPQTDGADNSAQRVLRHSFVAESLAAAIFTNPAFTKSLVSSFVVEKNKITPAWLAIYQQPLRLAGSYRSIALWMPELIAGRGAWLSDNPDAYRQITFPVKLIWGQMDTITPLSQAYHLRGLIPGAELAVIPDSGHVPMVEEPALFSRELIAGLPEIAPADRR